MSKSDQSTAALRGKRKRPEPEVAATQAPNPDLPDAEDFRTLLFTMDLIRRMLRDHLSPEDRPRYEFETALAETALLNGDVEGDPPGDDVKAAITKFRAIPIDQQRRILNGWHPDVLNTDRDEKRRCEDGAPLFPVLRMCAGGHDSPFARPMCSFDELADDERRTCTLFVAAGSTKADVLAALHALITQVDYHFDSLIWDPLDRVARGGKAGQS